MLRFGYMALLQIMGLGSTFVLVQVSASRLKEYLPGAHPFLVVKDSGARAKLNQAYLKLFFRFGEHHIPSHSIA